MAAIVASKMKRERQLRESRSFTKRSRRKGSTLNDETHKQVLFCDVKLNK